MAGLTPKQDRFVLEYLIDLNATQAAIRAGYSEKTAQEQSSRLLSNVMVAEAIEKARLKLAAKLEITAERVLAEYAKIGFADIRKMMTWDDERACFVPSTAIDDDTAGAIQSVKSKTRHTYDKEGNRETTIELEIKAHDKKGALDSISKTLGTFAPDKIEHSGEVCNVVIVEIPTNGRDDLDCAG